MKQHSTALTASTQASRPSGAVVDQSAIAQGTSTRSSRFEEGRAPRIVSPKAERIPALDFTKGVLVFLMVVYHWLNYFIVGHAQMYIYLRFLTPSFICISGFLVSHIYLSRYGGNPTRLALRLATRGLKILAVFVSLNMIIGLLGQQPARGAAMLNQFSTAHLISIFLTGNTLVGPGEKVAAFSILVPISYLLLLSALLVIVSQFYKNVFWAVGVSFLVVVIIFSFIGLEYTNLELVAIGLLGVLLGYLPIEKINLFLGHAYLLVAAYILYLAAITKWGPFYSLQIAGVLLSLMVIYLWGVRSNVEGNNTRLMMLLGKYSLFAYITQIAILQGLHRAMRPVTPGVAALGASFIAAFVLTFLSVAVVDRWRRRNLVVDKLYKAVFA